MYCLPNHCRAVKFESEYWVKITPPHTKTKVFISYKITLYCPFTVTEHEVFFCIAYSVVGKHVFFSFVKENKEYNIIMSSFII